jgi:SAM-dependent methyltransferase
MKLFEQFPKSRKPLPEAYQKIYHEHYSSNRQGATTATSVSMKMERWLHKKVAEDLQPGPNHAATLEIGAGTLNQLEFEDTQPYDIIEPYTGLYEGSSHLPKVRNIYKDIDELKPVATYDRITSVATFEHILNLPEVVEKTCKLLKPGGTLRVSIPNEGTLLWKLGYTLTTGIEFRLKYGLKYARLMNYEHVNTANEIEEILRYNFKEVKSATFGINKYLGFYRFFECKGPVHK